MSTATKTGVVTATLDAPVERTVTLQLPERTARRLHALLRYHVLDHTNELTGVFYALQDLGLIPFTPLGAKARPTDPEDPASADFIELPLHVEKA